MDTISLPSVPLGLFRHLAPLVGDFLFAWLERHALLSRACPHDRFAGGIRRFL